MSFTYDQLDSGGGAASRCGNGDWRAHKMAPTRVILMSCGSYNPPTNMHLRMFEIARDHLHRMGTHVVMGGVISPVHDAYSKKELISATHRCAMLRLALQNNDWIRLSTWETRQNCWTKTRLCLQHHQNLLNSILLNTNDIKHHIQIEDTEWIPENVKNSSDNTPIQIKLLCGADLLESFGIRGLWLEEDIDSIVGEHGLVVITREGSNPNKFIYDSDILSKHMHNICIVTEWIPNEVSSTRIRRALKRSESVRYLLQDSVIDYIYKNEIYDTKSTIKLELPSPNANNYLHIEPHYLSTFLTPSPSDVIMGSPSPIDIISTISIDMPDTCKKLQNVTRDIEAREQFINAITADNGNIKYVARAPAYPGQAKQVIVASENVARIVDEVGSRVNEPTAHQSDSSIHSKLVLEEDRRTSKVENVIEQKEVSNLKSITESTNDRKMMKIQSSPSIYSELTLEKDFKSTVKDVKSKEGLVLKTETVNVDLGASDDRERTKIPPEQLSVKELVLDYKSSEDIVKTKVASQLKSETEIDEGINLCKNVIKIQVSNLDYIESSPKGSYKSMIKSEIADVSLGSTDSHEFNYVQSNLHSNELRLSECCWPTRGNTANDDIEADGRDITQREIVNLNHSINESRITDKVYSDQVSFKIVLAEDSRSIESAMKSKADVNKETSSKNETVEVKSHFIDTGNIVKVQPGHSNYSAVKGDPRLRTTKAKPELDKRKTRSEEHLEPSKMSKNDKELNKLRREETMDSLELNNSRIGPGKEDIDLELNKTGHLGAEVTTLSPNVSITSLDGRYECALSDFSVDKEDWLNQYDSNKDEKEYKNSFYSTKSNVTDYVDCQKRDMIDNTIDFTDDSKSSKKNVAKIFTSVTSHEEEFKAFAMSKTDDCAMSKELPQSKFVARKPSLESEEDGKFNVESGERKDEIFKILPKIDKAYKIEEGLELSVHSLEKRMSSCDLNLEIDGKYLKSIVNSRKSPRKIREGQIFDVETKELQNRQITQSEVSQELVKETKNSEETAKDQIHDMDINKSQLINDQERTDAKKILQNSSKITSVKTKSPKKVKEFQTDRNDREIKFQDISIDDRGTSRTKEVFQNSPKTTSTKVSSSRKIESLQVSKDDSELKNRDEFISNREISRSVSQKSSRTSSASAKSPKKHKEKQIRYKSGEMKDYDRIINDRVISQLEEVFQNSSKKSATKVESPRKVSKGHIEAKDQVGFTGNQEMSKEFSQHSSKVSSTKSPKNIQYQGDTDDKKIIHDKPKQNFNEIKDVYTRKVRRYNMPLQGSLDSMIESDETLARKSKKDDAFTKKSKSYESIKRIQEVFLGVPNKTSSSGSQLDIPDEFCSICCYMNEITFRTEEEVSSPNQETFYTLRSACSSLADDDDSVECDICNSLNLQASDNPEGKVMMGSAHEEIPCELCKICGEVDSSFDQNSVVPTDRYPFRVVEPSQDEDDSFEIENCGFQSGTESADDRSRISEKERIKESSSGPKSQSAFSHGSSVTRDPPRELYLIPKDEIAILMSGVRRVNRKGSLFKKKEDPHGSVRNNRRYSSVDSLQLAKISAVTDEKMLNVAKDTMLVGSADNLQTSWGGLQRSKSLQRSADNVSPLRSSNELDPLVSTLGKEENAVQIPVDCTEKGNIRDKEAVKMILTQHGIKIISEKETAL